MFRIANGRGVNELLLVRIVLLGTLLALAGCASVPSGAPTTSELLSKEDSGTVSSAFTQTYELFDLDAEVAAVAGQRVWETLVGRLPRSRATSSTLGIGDAVTIAIFESSLGGLFSAPETSIAGGAKNVTLPNVTVDTRGFLRIPYAGLIKAAGHTPRQIEFAIEARLKGRAIDPQAVVTLIQNRSSLVTVAGLVKGPSRFPIGVANERLVDMIAQAGGLAVPDHEARIRIVRGGRSASVSMNTVITRPQENIHVRQGDTIFVEKAPRYVTLLGAASRNLEIPFKDEHMTISQVLGLAGGLMDSRADPTGVFIFRYENENILRRLRPGSPLLQRSSRPVIYRLNLKRADGYFVAQKFQMRSRDLVFISNAQGTQLQKFLNLVGTVLGSARGVAGTAISVSN